MGLRRAGTARLGVQELFITFWVPSGLSLDRERERQRDSKTDKERQRKGDPETENDTYTQAQPKIRRIRDTDTEGHSDERNRKEKDQTERQRRREHPTDQKGQTQRPAAAAWGRMAVRWEEGPSTSAARTAAPPPTFQNSAHPQRTATTCSRISSRQQPVRLAWTLVSVGRGRGRPTCRLDTNTTPSWTPPPVYKARLESVETSASSPYIYYNMQVQAIIKSGMSKVAEERAWGPTPGVPMRRRARPMQAHTLVLLSSRHGLCQAPHYEEIRHSRHLP